MMILFENIRAYSRTYAEIDTGVFHVIDKHLLLRKLGGSIGLLDVIDKHLLLRKTGRKYGTT